MIRAGFGSFGEIGRFPGLPRKSFKFVGILGFATESSKLQDRKVPNAVAQRMPSRGFLQSGW
jgi:hypothetical protein